MGRNKGWTDRMREARRAVAGLAAHPGARKAAEGLRWLRDPLIAVGLVFVATSAIAEPFYVPSGSMEPTLAIGDALVAAKYPYGYSQYSVRWGLAPDVKGRLFGHMPARGDVVVFHPPSHAREVWVKRVIGLPGDRIQMKAGRLVINGKMLPLKTRRQREVGNRVRRLCDRTQIYRDVARRPNASDLQMALGRPAGRHRGLCRAQGQLFMMGDNRDNSLDSRVAARDGGVGYVPVENVIGRADVVVGSYDFLNPGRWFGAFRLSRLFEAVR